jgi:hypothetical protein
LHSGAANACELAASTGPDARTARLRETIAAALPAGKRSFAFDREALAAWLDGHSAARRSAPMADTLQAAARELAAAQA